MGVSQVSGGLPTYSADTAAAIVAGLASAPVVTPVKMTGWQSFNWGYTVSTTVGAVSIAQQAAEPTKPADQVTSFATYGVVIPVSMGKRKMAGNVVYASDITSMLEGMYNYYIDYQIPVTTTTTFQGSAALDTSSINAPTFNDDLFGAFDETDSDTETTRVYQNNDDTSANYVDVERYKFITLTNSEGNSQTFNFTLD